MNMKAITLTQPYATLVALGAKRIETRGWSTRYRGPLAIHAGKGLAGMTKRQFVDLLRMEPFWSVLRPLIAAELHYFRPDALPRGAIVAVADLVDILPVEQVPPTEPERSFGDYTPGRYAWLLADARPLDPPIPATGRQGLWEWTESETAQIL
jgi:hypothetical protein